MNELNVAPAAMVRLRRVPVAGAAQTMTQTFDETSYTTSSTSWRRSWQSSQFLSFLEKRVSREAAEDILQEASCALISSLRSAGLGDGSSIGREHAVRSYRRRGTEARL